MREDLLQGLVDKGAGTLATWVLAELPGIQIELGALYQRLHAAAPNARILVLGYPALFPEAAPAWFDPQFAACTGFFTVWTTSERESIRQWGLELNARVRSAAHEAGVEYVDTFTYFSTHEACGGAGEWVRLVGLANSAVREGSFHPLREGQEAMARIVSCYLDVHPQPSVEGGTEPEDSRVAACLAGHLLESLDIVRLGGCRRLAEHSWITSRGTIVHPLVQCRPGDSRTRAP